LARKADSKDIRVSTCHIGQIIGFEDILKGRHHTTTLKCISTEGSLYIIKKEEFCHKLKRDENIWNALIAYTTQKDKEVINRVKNATKNIQNQSINK
jgi:hypothetical protein